MQGKPRDIALGVLRAIPAVILFGVLGYFGYIALQHALQHGLGPAVIVFVTGMVAMPLAWLPDPHISPTISAWLFAICAMAIAYVLFQAIEAQLYWETLVAFTIGFTPTLGVIGVRLMWWPLRGVPYEDRKAIFRALNRLPYEERQRIMWSGSYERLLHRGDTDDQDTDNQ